MEHKYEVRFSKRATRRPRRPWASRIALAREAARKLGVPNCESEPTYRVGTNSHTGETYAYVEWTWEGLRSIAIKPAESIKVRR